MPDKDDLSNLTQRLDRIEKTLSQLSSTVGIGTIADPPPDDFVRWRSELSNMRLIDLIRQLVPHGDPPPFDFVRARPELAEMRLIDLIRQLVPHGDPPPGDLVRGRGGLVEMRLADILQRNPGWITDPPPDDFLNVRIIDLIRRWRGGFTDPAPEDLANVRLRDLMQRIPGGGFTDPSPEDFGRLTKVELESLLHKVNTETLRLESLKRMINERLATLPESGRGT